MKQYVSAGNSSAEENFARLFCDTFGPDKEQYVYIQYPFKDIYGKNRTIDFAINCELGKIAFEIDGETWHNPAKISEDKYVDDLLKQNSMVYDGWKVYRWTDTQIDKTPERIQDELITFLGQSPAFRTMDSLPNQTGVVFELHEHQKDALENLSKLRDENKTIALVQGATGSGKSAICVFDAKSIGKRTLFLAHTKELVEQGYSNFTRFWPEVSAGRFYEKHKDTDTHVVCASIQSVNANLEQFKPDDFGYIVIDECHHAAAASYAKILSYFKADFILGLTATDERADGQDLLEIFQNVAHRLSLEDAVKTGVLCPVRCIRVKTNIDMHDDRINGFRYNSQDLETTVMVPDRNRLIVDTYIEYAKGKSTVIFCTSVKHADTIAELLRERGISAESVSGKTNDTVRKRILTDYADRKIDVLCACDLLNEGWDSPITEVLFMARPTMSKTVYVQQLGRGMRKHEGKEFLMVFDFVDNAGMFNCPYSIHRMLNLAEYVPGGLVLAKPSDMKWDKEMFRRGEKPQVLLEYPIHAMDFETIDLFNWQAKAAAMFSQVELTRRVSAQHETIERYIKEGKIIPDLEVPIGNNRSFKYFLKKRLKEYCDSFGWRLITNENRKDEFIEMLRKMTMTYSYKPVFIQSLLNCMNDSGEAVLSDVADDFIGYYENRKRRGLSAEKKTSKLNSDYTKKEIEHLILSYPFRRFEDMGFIHHSKNLGIISIDKGIMRTMTAEDTVLIRNLCTEALNRYWGDNV